MCRRDHSYLSTYVNFVMCLSGPRMASAICYTYMNINGLWRENCRILSYLCALGCWASVNIFLFRIVADVICRCNYVFPFFWWCHTKIPSDRRALWGSVDFQKSHMNVFCWEVSEQAFGAWWIKYTNIKRNFLPGWWDISFAFPSLMDVNFCHVFLVMS